MTAITRKDAPVAVEGDGVELRVQSIGGGMSVAFVQFPEGTDMGPALEGLADDLCPCPHWGYLIKGRLKMRTPNGDELYKAGEAFYWPPGHAPVALEDCEYLDFSPTADFERVLEHIKAQGS